MKYYTPDTQSVVGEVPFTTDLNENTDAFSAAAKLDSYVGGKSRRGKKKPSKKSRKTKTKKSLKKKKKKSRKTKSKMQTLKRNLLKKAKTLKKSFKKRIRKLTQRGGVAEFIDLPPETGNAAADAVTFNAGQVNVNAQAASICDSCIHEGGSCPAVC